MYSISQLTWNYFATGHGKGVVDGIGGEAKSLVRQQVLSKSKNVVVQSAADFAKICKDVMPGVTIHLMTQEDLNELENIWDQAVEVKGISKAHQAVIKDGSLSIYAHANMKDPINTIAIEEQLKPEEQCQIKLGDFVKVIHGNFKGYHRLL